MNEELKVIISAEISKLKQNVANAKKEVTGFKDKVADAKKDVDKNFKAMGEGIKNALKVGTVAIAAAGTALMALGASTEEYRQNQAKLKTAFEAAGGSADEAAQTYNDLYRVLGDDGQATEAAAHLAQLTTNEKDLAEWTTICQGVYATFGDSIPIEGLTEAANETAKVGQVTGSLADALNWAGISEDAFNESLAKCNNEAEREKLIRETLNGLYSKTASEYEKNNKNVLAQREAQAKLAETTARLGEALAPVQTALTELANKALSAIAPYVEKFAQDYLPKIQEVLSVVGEKLGEALNYIKEHKEILAVLAGIIGGIVVAIGLYNTVAAIKTAMDAAQVTTVWGLVAAHIAQAAAAMAAIAPYLLIVAAIAAVIAIIVLCVKHWDEIVAAVKQAWENIKKFVAEGVQKVIDFFTNLWDSIVSGLQAAWNWITGILNGAVNWVYNTVVAPIANFFTGMWDGLKNGAKAAWEGIKGVFGGVANWFKNIFSNAWNAVKKVFSTGGKIFSGIKDGIVAAFKTVVNAIINGINRVIAIPFNTINGILNWIKDITIVGIKPFDGLWKRNPLAVPQIPLLAKGGVVDGATLAMIGEQGKEAVVPLENNTEWLDKLAVMLNNRMGGNGRPIVLQVDGKTFAQISVDSINNLTRQSGSLPLVIA